jgi:hypothetical protein
MSEHFCHNQACPFHVEMTPENVMAHPGRSDLSIRSYNGDVVRSTRWPIVRADDNKQFFFCTTCANVAAMLHSLK